MKSIIPAAGLGTRFLPGTKVTPKEMLPVLDKPVIQYVVEEALAPEEVDECIIVSSQAKPQIMSYFTPDLALEDLLRSRNKAGYAEAVKEAGSLPVDFCFQSEPLGLGHAIRCASYATGNEPFFVLLGDYMVPDKKILPRMMEVSKAHGGASVIAVAPRSFAAAMTAAMSCVPMPWPRYAGRIATFVICASPARIQQPA